MATGGGSLTAAFGSNAVRECRSNSLKPYLKAISQQTVQWILQQPGGVNVNARGEQYGWTALHLASLRGHVAIVHAILQVDGVHVNARTLEGVIVTPLHLACCSSDRLLVVQALLERGADLNAADNNDGDSPLFAAVIVGYVDVVEALQDAGADPA